MDCGAIIGGKKSSFSREGVEVHALKPIPADLAVLGRRFRYFSSVHRYN